MRTALVGTVLALSLFCGEAAWSAAPLYPATGYSLKTGTETSAGAPLVEVAQDDNDYLVIDSHKDKVVYVMTFDSVPEPVNSVGTSFIGHASTNCTLSISLYKWRQQRWHQITENLSVMTTDNSNGAGVQPAKPYWRNGKVKVKYSFGCGDFTLSTDQVGVTTA